MDKQITCLPDSGTIIEESAVSENSKLSSNKGNDIRNSTLPAEPSSRDLSINCPPNVSTTCPSNSNLASGSIKTTSSGVPASSQASRVEETLPKRESSFGDTFAYETSKRKYGKAIADYYAKRFGWQVDFEMLEDVRPEGLKEVNDVMKRIGEAK
jgi:hypothetical protein